MFVVHVDLQAKPGLRSSLEKAFVETFQPAISTQEGLTSVGLLRLKENENNYRLVIAFRNRELQQKWVATDVHQQAWPAMERPCAQCSVSFYDAV